MAADDRAGKVIAVIDTDPPPDADALDGVPGAKSPGLTWRRPEESDHWRVLAVLDRWWAGFGGAAGSRERGLLLPRLSFQHFSGTSWLVEQDDAAGAGAHRVSCITSPGNAGPIALHQRLGFDVLPGASRARGVSVHPDDDGPGLDRVLFSRTLE